MTHQLHRAALPGPASPRDDGLLGGDLAGDLAGGLAAHAELAILVGLAAILAGLLAILAIAVATEGGRLGRLGVDRLAARDRRGGGDPAWAVERSPAGGRDDGNRLDGRPGAGDAADDPWREAGRRVVTVTPAP